MRQYVDLVYLFKSIVYAEFISWRGVLKSQLFFVLIYGVELYSSVVL